MQYAILCYNQEQLVSHWPEQKDRAVMAHHQEIITRLARAGKAGPVLRLMPTTAATTVRAGRQPVIIDGPFAETKEQLLGLFVIDVETLDEALGIAAELSLEPGAMEVRPLQLFCDFSHSASVAPSEVRPSLDSEQSL
jgi:hypothetical protein